MPIGSDSAHIVLVSPLQTPYERMYAQVKALVEEGTYSYWFDIEEIEVLDKHNENFRAQENEEQLLPILFDVPAEGKGKFMTTAAIARVIRKMDNPLGILIHKNTLGKAYYYMGRNLSLG